MRQYRGIAEYPALSPLCVQRPWGYFSDDRSAVRLSIRLNLGEWTFRLYIRASCPWFESLVSESSCRSSTCGPICASRRGVQSPNVSSLEVSLGGIQPRQGDGLLAGQIHALTPTLAQWGEGDI